MHWPFRLVGISHKSASVEVRERFSFSKEEQSALLLGLREQHQLQELLVLCTCNRTELYYVSAEAIHHSLIGSLISAWPSNEAKTQPKRAHDYTKHFYTQEGQAAIKHLFEVALGLDAQILGDRQIITQVKAAYQQSADLQLAGPHLHRLMHAIFYTHKRVENETSFHQGHASLSSASLELIQELQPHPSLFLIGWGAIAQDLYKGLASIQPKQVYRTNRTKKTSERASFACQWVPWKEWTMGIQQAQVVVSCINRKNPFICPEHIRNQKHAHPLFLIDLSVPRSIDPLVGELPGVRLYNIDAITQKASRARAQRLQSLTDVNALVKEAVLEFAEWVKEMRYVPLIQDMKALLNTLRKEEMTRHIKNMNASEAEWADRITKGFVQRILKYPALNLKAACRRGNPHTLAEALKEIFYPPDALDPLGDAKETLSDGKEK